MRPTRPRDALDPGLAAAYSFLQRVVGLIALTLPVVLLAGGEISGDGLQGSISSYYYTRLGSYFVGALCALAVFFLSYNFRPLPDYGWDNVLSHAAALMAFGVAMFPTASDGSEATGGAHVVATIHLVCACALFVLLGVFSSFRFTLTDDPKTTTPQKRRRNVLYRVCGATIFGAIAGVVVMNATGVGADGDALFWLETVAVEAFAVSWLVKGGFMRILADAAV